MIYFSESKVLLKGMGREEIEKKKNNCFCIPNKNCFLKDSQNLLKIEYRKKLGLMHGKYMTFKSITSHSISILRFISVINYS